MLVGVPRETFPGERRVALVPSVVPTLAKSGLEVVVEAGAGIEAGYPDADYTAKGAKIVGDRAEIFRASDIIVKVLAHGSNPKFVGKADLPQFHRDQVLIGFLRPLGELKTIQQIAATGVTSFAVELIPRTTRAQAMDALSSMGTICGYKAVLIAADTLPRIFPMLTTAAGTITPARVLFIGAGVAGLQPSRQLAGLAPSRPHTTCGQPRRNKCKPRRRFVELPSKRRMRRMRVDTQQPVRILRKQRAAGSRVGESDVVITAAVIPGKKSPVLVTADMVAKMAPGSVIVDLASERGGNCELTRPGEKVVANGVTIIGRINLASTVPYHASQMYARNITAFLQYLVHDGKLELKLDDEIVRSTLLTRGGEIVNERVREFLSLPALATAGKGAS
jgi:NAD(P) transhydrogenase subunit alpha